MLEAMKSAAVRAIASYRVGLGRRFNFIIDRADGPSASGKESKFGQPANDSNLTFFSLPVDQFNRVDFLSVPNGDNTAAKIYMLVEVGEMEMTDESLRF
jgi:hypothetical protein